jgi:hypothetical protein
MALRSGNGVLLIAVSQLVVGLILLGIYEGARGLMIGHTRLLPNGPAQQQHGGLIGLG